MRKRQGKDIHPEQSVENTALGGIQTHDTLHSRQVLYYMHVYIVYCLNFLHGLDFSVLVVGFVPSLRAAVVA